MQGIVTHPACLTGVVRWPCLEKLGVGIRDRAVAKQKRIILASSQATSLVKNQPKCTPHNAGQRLAFEGRGQTETNNIVLLEIIGFGAWVEKNHV